MRGSSARSGSSSPATCTVTSSAKPPTCTDDGSTMFPSLSARRRWRLSRRRLSITCRTSLLDSDCVWWAKSSTLCSTKLHGAADTSSPEQEASASCSPPSSFACSRPMVAWASMSSRWSWITSLSFSSITVAHSGWRIIWKVASWCSATNNFRVLEYFRWAAQAGSHRAAARGCRE